MNYVDVYQQSRLRQTVLPALWCDVCYCEIYPQEAYYELSERRVCSACLQESCLELFAEHRRFAPDPEVRA